jgi:hypothetical protein
MQRVFTSFNITPDELRQGLLSSLKHDHPDAMLLRFLRARKWDVGKAFVLLISSIAWRTKEMHVDDDIVPRGELDALQQSRSANPAERILGTEFMQQLRMGKNIIHGVDKAGRPIVDIRVRLHRPEAKAPEVIERYIVHTMESVRMLLRPPMVETAVCIHSVCCKEDEFLTIIDHHFRFDRFLHGEYGELPINARSIAKLTPHARTIHPSNSSSNASSSSIQNH